ncbi:hypothetical protein AYI69_g7240 [Smittium culicis]|uniref:Uncharacterized protein n=1 Tax=Smittium culicis TaxID=133412 RepID=A0A1R1XTH4_9FUNG|nr:hypothetical protein AYI69_g7240 [Smittium culicis]
MSEKKIMKFDITLENISYVISDEARVNIKACASIQQIHQLCFAHAIHLAVIKSLYVKVEKSKEMVLINQKNTQKVSDLSFMDDFAVIEQKNEHENPDEYLDMSYKNYMMRQSS